MVPDDKLYSCSAYVVTMVFESLREMFSNARDIQEWFLDSSGRIARAGQPVQWITPLGMPVVQPYHKTMHKEVC